MNYIILDGVKYLLMPEEATNCKEEGAKLHMEAFGAGEVCKIGEWEFIVCEHTREGTVLLMKDCLYDAVEFGDNNNYNGSNVDKLCEEFADKLVAVVGSENIIRHTVDLTADDGLRDYGSIERRVSLFTADQYRKYCDILDKYRLNIWTWTATAYSTPKHDDDCWVKCVAPRGYFSSSSYSFDGGVRPFCILKSNIFVSK